MTIGGSGRRAEIRFGRDTGAELRPASGAGASKGDATIYDLLLEMKSTVGRSLSVKFDWLTKITREARMEGRTPALVVAFVDDNGRPIRNGRWIMLREDDLISILEARQ